jgi:two-component system chemotaxis response regulator CheY
MRVLIADDQRAVGRSLADLVRCCHHEIVSVVGSGLEAIQAYSHHHPDLVLMDYWMPKLNGATACRNILAKDPGARVILVSGWSPSDDASQSGALSILLKPVDLDRLNAMLQSIAQTLPLPAPAEMLIPEVRYQPNPLPEFSSLPGPNSELPPPSPELPSLSSELPSPSFHMVPPSLEMSFPVEATTSHLQQNGEACALDEEKIPGRHRSSRRRAHRAR